jgi:hypothetical protein
VAAKDPAAAERSWRPAGGAQICKESIFVEKCPPGGLLRKESFFEGYCALPPVGLPVARVNRSSAADLDPN